MLLQFTCIHLPHSSQKSAFSLTFLLQIPKVKVCHERVVLDHSKYFPQYAQMLR